MKKTLLTAFILVLVCTGLYGETWGPFYKLAEESDCIVQVQILRRDGKFVSSRIVKVYWEKKGFKRPKDLLNKKGWDLKEYNRKTDKVLTQFSFWGRGQHLWTVRPENGVVQFPGKTAHRVVGEEISCSAAEFDDILEQVGRLKREGKDLKKNLVLSVFGKKKDWISLWMRYENSSGWGENKNGLRLHLSTLKKKYRQGEQIGFKLDMINASDNTIEVEIEERGWLGFVELSDGSKTWRPPVGKWRGKKVSLEKGKVISCEIATGWLTESGKLSFVGKYRIPGTDEVLESAPLTVEIEKDEYFMERFKYRHLADRLVGELNPLLKGFSEDASINKGLNFVTIEFKARDYMVYPALRFGGYGDKLVKRRGPHAEGFVVYVSLADNYYSATHEKTAVTFDKSEADNHTYYYRTRGFYNFRNTDAHMAVTVLFNDSTDTKFLEKLYSKLNEVVEKADSKENLGKLFPGVRYKTYRLRIDKYITGARTMRFKGKDGRPLPCQWEDCIRCTVLSPQEDKGKILNIWRRTLSPLFPHETINERLKKEGAEIVVKIKPERITGKTFGDKGGDGLSISILGLADTQEKGQKQPAGPGGDKEK